MLIYIVTFTVVCHWNLVLGTKNKVELWFCYWDHNLFCLQRNQNLKFSLFFLSCCFSQKKLNHCVLRALKTSWTCSRRQTYVFQSKIAQEIQKWVQNNQLLSLPSNVFFKKLFSAPKIIKKNVCFVDFWIFMVISMDKVDQFIENNCRNFRIS